MSESILKIIFQGESENLDKKLKEVGGKLDKFNKKASALGKSLSTKLTLPLAIAGGAAIKLASDFQESLNKVDVAFGSSQQAVRDFAQTSLKQFGIAEGSALDMAALFGDMATSMGLSQKAAASMSTQLVGLAGDLASFKNIDIEQATTALAGVFTGETESLKRLGIVMTEVNLQQFAMEKGLNKSVKKMTQAEKVALRYEFIMSKTANAQGDFARTGGGAANQMRIFQESLKELGVSFGQILLPAFTKLVTKLNDIIQGFNETSPEVKGFITLVGLLAGAVGPLLIAIPKVTSAFKLLTLAMKANPIIAVASALAAVATSIYSIAKAKKEAKLDEFNESLEGLSREDTLARLRELNKQLRENNKLIHGFSTAGEKHVAKKENESLGEQIKLLHQRLLVLRKDADLKRIANNDSKKSQTLGNLGLNQDTVLQEQIDQERIKTNRRNFLDDVFAITDKGQSALEHRFNQNAERLKQPLAKSQSALFMFNKRLKEEMDKSQEIANASGAIITGGFQQLAEGIGFALGEAISSGGNLASALATVLLQTLGSMAIQLGQLAIKIGIAMASIKMSFKNPFTAIAAGIALIAVGKMIQSAASVVGGGDVKKFAKGGIVSTPTLGLMGEYPGARSNPEVIAPLDKLQGMIANTGGSRVEVGGQFTLKGQDLVVALQRADRNRQRIK
jgi:hypothetical protein